MPAHGRPYLGDNGTVPDNYHIESFFTNLRDTHISGVKETYYPHLPNLLNVIGTKEDA